MNEIQKTTNNEGLTIDMISSLLWCWWLDQNPFSMLTTEKTQRTSSTFNDAFLPKQVTGGHNVLADRWAGASNLHPHPYLDPHTQTYTNKYQERSFSHFWLDHYGQTNQQTDGQMDKASYRVACQQLQRPSMLHQGSGWGSKQSKFCLRHFRFQSWFLLLPKR